MTETEDLIKAVEKLNANVERLVHKQSVLSSFFSGLLSGLGSVMGATVVVALLVWLLGRLQLVPVIGAWVASIVKVVQINLSIH